MPGFLIRMLITALGLWVASGIVPGLEIRGLGTLLGSALLLGFVNAVIRPLIVLLTLPITILTLGIFLLVVNAAMLGLVASFFDNFTISGLFPAILGSVIVSLVSWFASWCIGPKGRFDIMIVRR
jgi:putative membrane protein